MKSQKHLNQPGSYPEQKTIITNQHFQATQVTMLARKHEVLHQVTKKERKGTLLSV